MMSDRSPSEEERPLISPQTLSSQRYDSGRSAQFSGTADRKKTERRLLKKLDIRMSVLMLMYIVSCIDRSSAAAARLRGFEDDLGLKGPQFASVLSAFFVGYIIMQIPSNMILSQVKKPSLYLPCCMILCGSTSFLTGFAHNYYGALVARFLLGLSEATFFPGALYLIAKWYKRDELSLRTAFLVCGTNVSMAFGALIASGVLDLMDGVLGCTAWRWLFFVEGGLTIIIAIIAIFILPDYPETETIPWLTSSEHALAKARMREDAAAGVDFPKRSDKCNSEVDSMIRIESTATTGFILALTDWKVWFVAFAQFFFVVSCSHYLYFPTLTETMGYNSTISLLLCAPPWLISAAWSLWISWHSDNKGERCMHVVIPYLIATVGFILAISTMNTIVRYLSLFLLAQALAGYICLIAWSSSTVSNPPEQRAVALALINTISQSGNIVGSFVWVKAWGPAYKQSFAICGIAGLISLVMCLWLRKALKRMNKEMDLRDKMGEEAVYSKKGWRYYT
ncbi:hypothetical protein AGABI2DRAFT_192148 [Agaricus bisporus var. bisporus H97]|uniref:hypothetical protein n=1 Tax=Agaricus bisporus var. bisporus (strain H97 / ATCC MYA-4626 / FGSC 10389) TaxID=936046 RepID=UPI00029F7A8B|nr:hypothetical protein AGABI2DRAFT_192148 [Agaricus bisporus var. bisporus H97]EKV48580.1 hypothetical protein AGABI2DRAFT_192148 [Agaricus bisporus var. bisporus H97]